MKMRMLNLILSAILAAPGLASAMTSRQAVQIFTAVTNVATVPSPAPTQPAQAPSTDLVAAGTFVRPTIAVGTDGRLYVGAEGPGMASLHLYVSDSKGRWTGEEIVHASKDTAGRCYVGDIVVDADGWCWFSFRWGNKEYGKLHGPGVWIRSPSGSGKLYYPGITLGGARLAIDPSLRTVLLSKNGEWGAIGRDGSVTRRGIFPAGLTGEKFDFAIGSDGIWHTAHNGSALQASAYAWGTAAGGQRITWADDKTYPDMANDLCYVSLAIAADGAAWCGTILSGRLKVQRIAKGALRWPATALGDLGPATLEQRCPPRLIAATGGVEALYVKSGSIYRVNVQRALAGKATPSLICAGANPAVCTDAAGRLHMVYIQGGALRYRAL